MNRVILLALICCALFAVMCSAGEGGEADKAVAQDKVFVVITMSGKDEKLPVFYERIRKSIDYYFGGLDAKLIDDKDAANPSERGFLILSDFEKSVKFKFSQGSINTYTWCYYGKYKLYESKDGKWKSCGSGVLRIHNRYGYGDQLAMPVLEKLTSIKVKAKTADVEAVKLSGKITNKSAVTLNGIGVLAPMNGDVPFVEVKPFLIVEKLEPGQTESFSIDVPLKAAGNTDTGNKKVTATYIWKKAYVAMVNIENKADGK